MTNARRGFLCLSLIFSAVLVAQASSQPTSVSVDCDNGQSLNQTLAKLNKLTPTTVLVSGTCTEYVDVFGFESLILKGQPGATWRSHLAERGLCSPLFFTLSPRVVSR